MRLDLAIVKDLGAILKANGIAEIFALRNDLAHLILLGGGKILGVGTGISEIPLFVKPLDDGKAICHGHFIFFTEHVLQLGKRIELTRLQRILFALHGLDHGARGIHPGTKRGSLFPALCGVVQLLLACQLHALAVRFLVAVGHEIFARHEIADGHIALVDGTHNRRDHAADAQQRAAFDRCIAREINAVKPINIGARQPLVGKVLIGCGIP